MKDLFKPRTEQVPIKRLAPIDQNRLAVRGEIMKNSEKTNSGTAAGGNNALIAAAAVIIVLAAAYLYFSPAAGPAPAPQPAPTANQMATPEAQLLLSSFDRGAALTDYSAAYTSTDNGGTLTYKLAKGGAKSWVEVNGGFGSMQGFVGSNNTTDIVCLNYSNSTECAVTGNDAQMQGIASTLRVLLLNPLTYTQQKAQTETLINGGVIKFSPGITSEQVGPFAAQKITYTLNYGNLTVNQINAMGIPNDPALFAITNWHVAMWVDKATGMTVKSQASYNSGGVQYSYDTEYAMLQIGTPTLPAVPAAPIGAAEFVNFYATSQQDYSTVLSCEAMTGTDRDSCYKAAATNRNSYGLCQKISDKTQFESCALIVASATNQSAYCQNLSISDDCYISVVANTGDYSLCRLLKNTSLGSTCTQAAMAGKQLADAAAAKQLAYAQGMNCHVNSDCKTAGNANQYCVAGNNPGPFQNDSSPDYVCLKGVPCGCNGGYCGFEKNYTYYSCINTVEDQGLEAYIASLGTNSSKNASG